VAIVENIFNINPMIFRKINSMRKLFQQSSIVTTLCHKMNTLHISTANYCRKNREFIPVHILLKYWTSEFNSRKSEMKRQLDNSITRKCVLVSRWYSDIYKNRWRICFTSSVRRAKSLKGRYLAGEKHWFHLRKIENVSNLERTEKLLRKEATPQL
jgi:hypothetical protein